ncbi:hypothetical protein HN51_062851 [Arachis hypogaea]
MSSSHYTKNGRNVMLKITSSQTASSPDSNASEKKRKELEKERAKDELLTRKRQREERRVRYRVQCGGPKAACAGCVGFGVFSVVIEKFLDRHE